MLSDAGTLVVSEGKQEYDDVYGDDAQLSIIKEGFLHKKKQKGLRLGMMNWQHRYCVLDNVEMVFRYGPYEGSCEGARSVPFCDIKRAYLIDGTPSDAVDEKGIALNGGLEFCIELSASASRGNAARTFTFRAQDPVNARDWTREIHAISLQGRGEKRVSKVVLQKLASFRSTSLPKDGGQFKNSMTGRKISTASDASEVEETKDDSATDNAFVTSCWESKAAQAVAAAAAREEKMQEEADQSRQKLKTLTARIISRAKDRRMRTESEGRDQKGSTGSTETPPGSPRGLNAHKDSPMQRFETDTLEANVCSGRARQESYFYNVRTKCLPSMKNSCLPCYAFVFGRGGPEMEVDLSTVTGDPEQDFGNLAPGTYR